MGYFESFLNLVLPILIIAMSIPLSVLMYINYKKSIPYKSKIGGNSKATHIVMENDGIKRLKLQAAERFVLYLERISPNYMVLRLHRNNMNAKMLHSEMVKAIRDEFEHNLSQQIYVSDNGWELVKNAKEETIKLCNISLEKCDELSSGIDFARKVFEIASLVKKAPTEIAVNFLKAEVREYL
jgi:hypothetical protein